MGAPSLRERGPPVPGAVHYYRRFVPNFANLAAPLHALTSKYNRFEWNQSCTEAFETLRERLVSAPVLALPESEGRFLLDTDASDLNIGAVLSQIQRGEERVIAYASGLLTRYEKNYSVTRKELLAAVFYVKAFRQFLLGRQFTLRTDHAALLWLKRTPEPLGQQARWIQTLEEFDY